MPIFAVKFEPILLPGHTATLMSSEFPPEGQPVRCKAVGGLPEYINDFGALTAATWLSDQEDDNLEMGDKELAQLRMRVLDNFKTRLKNPGTTQYWRSAKTNYELTMLPAEELDGFKDFLWASSEFFIWEDTTPRFDLYSTTALTASRISFSGWRFKLQFITKGELTSPAVIWVNEWPSGA